MDSSTINPVPEQDGGGGDDDSTLHRRESPLPVVLYKECYRNTNDGTGRPEARDGCREFKAAGKDGSVDALKCADCGCHRNYHRGMHPQPKASDFERVANEVRQLARKIKRKETHPSLGTAVEVLEKISKLFPLLAKVIEDADDTAPANKSGGEEDEKEKQTLLEDEEQALIKDNSPSSDDRPKKKRSRTVFAQEQVAKLKTLAESVGWALGNISKERQATAAMEIGISVESLKYWFHNTKQKRKKPARKSA